MQNNKDDSNIFNLTIPSNKLMSAVGHGHTVRDFLKQSTSETLQKTTHAISLQLLGFIELAVAVGKTLISLPHAAPPSEANWTEASAGGLGDGCSTLIYFKPIKVQYRREGLQG